MINVYYPFGFKSQAETGFCSMENAVGTKRKTIFKYVGLASKSKQREMEERSFL